MKFRQPQTIASLRIRPKLLAGYFGDVGVTRGLGYLLSAQFTAVARWAQRNRASVQGGNLVDGCCDECAHESKHQHCCSDHLFHGFSLLFRPKIYKTRIFKTRGLRRTGIIEHMSSTVARTFNLLNPPLAAPSINQLAK
jgi:hypothetical protein